MTEGRSSAVVSWWEDSRGDLPSLGLASAATDHEFREVERALEAFDGGRPGEAAGWLLAWNAFLYAREPGRELAKELALGAAWAQDAVAHERSYLADLHSGERVAYRGRPEDFDAFLLDAFAAGVPFEIDGADLGPAFPTGEPESRWFRATLDQVDLLEWILDSVRECDEMGVRIDDLSAAVSDDGTSLLLETPAGTLHLGVERGALGRTRFEVRHSLAIGGYYAGPPEENGGRPVPLPDIHPQIEEKLEAVCTGLATIVTGRAVTA